MTATQPGKRRWTLAATSLGFAVIQLDVGVVNVAVRPIGAALGGGVSDLQWVISAYTIVFASLILTAGAIADRFGAKRVFLAGFGVFTVASVACGLAPSMAALIAARAIQGIGAAMLAPSSLALLNHTSTDPAERARAVGLWLAGASAALAGGPLIGGVLIATLGWRAIFFINVPIGLFGALAAARWASETPRGAGRGVDLPGQLAAVICLVSLAGATIEGGARGFGYPLALGGFAVALLAGVAFVLVEGRREEPMLPLGLFRVPAFASAAVIGLLVNVAFYGLVFVFSLFFQRGQRLSALQTGLAFAPSTGAILAANLLAGRLDARFGPGRVIVAGAVALAVGAGGLLWTGTGSSYLALVVQLVLLGGGLGMVVPAITAALLGSVERSRSGVASGTLNTARQSGSVIGVALFGAMIGGRGDLVSGLHHALAVAAVLALVIAGLGAALARGGSG